MYKIGKKGKKKKKKYCLIELRKLNEMILVKKC